MPQCGPPPRQSDFTLPNGNVRWVAYNKAYKRWLLCVNPEVARARAEGVGAGLEAAGDIAGDALNAWLASQGAGVGAGFPGVDFQQQQPQPQPQKQPQPQPPTPPFDVQKWALPAVAGLALLTLLRR